MEIDVTASMARLEATLREARDVEHGVEKRAQCPDCGSRRIVRYAPSVGIVGPGDECLSCGWFQCDE